MSNQNESPNDDIWGNNSIPSGTNVLNRPSETGDEGSETALDSVSDPEANPQDDVFSGFDESEEAEIEESDEEDTSDWEDDESDMDSDDDTQSQESTSEKKEKSGNKRMMLVGGGVVLLTSLLAAGYTFVSAPSSRGQLPRLAQVPSPQVQTPVAVQQPLPSQRPAQQSASVDFMPERVDMPVPDGEAIMFGEEARLTAEQQGPELNPALVDDLVAQTDELSKMMEQARSDIQLGQTRSLAVLTRHDERLNSLEEAVKALSSTIEELKKPATKPASKPAVKTATAKDTAGNKAVASSAKPKTTQTPAKAAAARSAPAPRQAETNLNQYQVVATYPSTEKAGMQAQRAWVTNGEQLVELKVGATIQGARVTRIEHTTVHTTAGIIHPARF